MPNICRVGSLFAMFTLVVACSASASTLGGTDTQAPYRIEKYTKTTVTVDFGTVDPSLKNEQLKMMTLLTEAGPELVTLEKFDEVCAYLCGEPGGVEDEEDEEDIGPTCHYTGLYTRSGKSGSEPMAALAGQVTISAWTTLVGKKSETGVEPSQWITDGYHIPVGGFAGEYRWSGDETTGIAVLVNRSMGPDFYAPPIVLNSCELEEYRNYQRLMCGSNAELLYSSTGDILILSLGEYGNAAAQPIAEFATGDAKNVLVRVGLKAHAAFGILTRTGGYWKLLIRPLDYPLIC